MNASDEIKKLTALGVPEWAIADALGVTAHSLAAIIAGARASEIVAKRLRHAIPILTARYGKS